MQRTFLVILVVASAFVWLTSGDLPPVVASHFGPGGAANGFTSKSTYTAFMLALVIAVPALIGFSAMFVRILPPRLINLPNRDYWLAPERSDGYARLAVLDEPGVCICLGSLHVLRPLAGRSSQRGATGHVDGGSPVRRPGSVRRCHGALADRLVSSVRSCPRTLGHVHARPLS